MNKTMLMLAGAALLGGIIWWSQARTPGGADASGPGNADNTITVTQAASLADVPDYDFGSISMAKGKVAHRYEFTNTGDAPLVINKMYTSCMCTQSYLERTGKNALGPFGMPGHGFVPGIDEAIAPGETFTVRAVFDPAAHGPSGIGRIDRQVILETSAGQVATRFGATVTP